MFDGHLLDVERQDFYMLRTWCPWFLGLSVWWSIRAALSRFVSSSRSKLVRDTRLGGGLGVVWET